MELTKRVNKMKILCKSVVVIGKLGKFCNWKNFIALLNHFPALESLEFRRTAVTNAGFYQICNFVCNYNGLKQFAFIEDRSVHNDAWKVNFFYFIKKDFSKNVERGEKFGEIEPVDTFSFY